MTVKFNDEERAKVKEMATLLGWTESQVVRDSLAFTHRLIFTPNQEGLPRLIVLGQLAHSQLQLPASSTSNKAQPTNSKLIKGK